MKAPYLRSEFRRLTGAVDLQGHQLYPGVWRLVWLTIPALGVSTLVSMEQIEG